MEDTCNASGTVWAEKMEKKEINEKTISLTMKAAVKIKEFILKKGEENIGLRVRVVSGGCCGYTYSITLNNRKEEDDMKIESNGITLYIDKESESLLRGSVIDFMESPQGTGFKLRNPNTHSVCGCGKSWS
ncbi:MAG: iron-sulfur cluster assembly accessory protein [Candidatus Diapherotrites archaeon]